MQDQPNHNSRAKIPASNQDKEEIRSARISAGLTQTQAAQIIYCNLRTWQQWESSYRRMHPAFFELFLKKTGQID
jgi:DNA-binding transcriptional regulator YiaG